MLRIHLGCCHATADYPHWAIGVQCFTKRHFSMLELEFHHPSMNSLQTN